MMNLYYAAIGPGGDVVGVERDIDRATNIALDHFPESTVQVEELGGDAITNPRAAADMPQIAARNCRIPIIPERAASMPLEHAHQKLYRYFEGLIKRGAPTKAYETARGMADAWIGQNYKTGKAHPEQPSLVMGLTLVPASHPRLASRGEGPYAHLLSGPKRAEGEQMIARWKEELPFDANDKKFTFCTGSNQNCRDACLVFAGQNASELYNTYRKIAQTMALLNEPEAFARMLVESIDRFVRSREIASGTLPFMRLNVLSDIPWEIICPWLFRRFERLQFYDYTKVPGRRLPTNYDLTFSVSGTNLEYAQDEINARDRRVAVVFLGHKMKGGSWTPIKVKGAKLLAQVPLPRTFWGLPVVDGDISDVRPLDPAPSCVGLRWKTPSGKRAGVTVDITSKQFSFVTPVFVVDAELAGRLVNPEGGSLSREQYLISPVTPRYQPIMHDVALPM